MTDALAQHRLEIPKAAQATLLLLGGWALMAATTFTAEFPRLPDGVSNDDAMRLVGVRDLLAGQGWFDLMQYRLGPAGVLMHWSRLIDLPIALLMKFLRLFVDAPLAERLAIATWPLLVLLPALAGLRALARALAGEAAGNLAVVLGIFLAPAIGHFRPGAIDHHNVQIALLLWTAAWILRFSTRDGCLAGCATACSLAIGLEILPALAVLAASVGVRWILQGERSRQPSTGFGLAFAGATAALVVATIPQARWFAATCDALSIVHLWAAVVGGAGLALLATTCSTRSMMVRIAGAAVLGICAVAAVASIAPDCLANPYAAVHPKLQEFWLANVAETQSLLSMLKHEPVDAIALYAPPFVALLLSVMLAVPARGEAALRWAVVAALELALLAVGLWEVRGTASANFVAAPLLAAALISLLPTRGETLLVFGQRPAALVAAAVLTPLLLAVAGNAVAGVMRPLAGAAKPVEVSSQAGCRNVSSFSKLATLPPGRVLGFIDNGAFILMQSPQSVLAAPYHRNNDGNLAAIETLLAPVAEAPARLKQNGVDYVVICPGSPEFTHFKRAGDGLAVQLVEGHVPGFLQPVAEESGPLRVYRFIR